jgi:Cd2+/Zn2+-exporting ATPase
MSDDCCHEESCCNEDSGAKKRTFFSGLLILASLIWELVWPETQHGTLWEGHLGVSDGLLVAASLVGGYNFFPYAVRAVRRLSLDMDFLMTAAILGACAIGEYTEAAAIAFLFSCAELLEAYAVDRARNSLNELMELAPETATVRRAGHEIKLTAAEVVVGDTVLIRPGERVPMDGKVATGDSTIDQSTITGESMPAAKRVGDEVFAGTINHEGYLEVEASHLASQSVLSRIIKMVEEAEERRAPIEQFVRRFARFYTPAVTLLALGVVLVPPLLMDASFNEWFVRGLTLLVIACPCALVISTPVAVVSGITSAARNGVLIKGGNHLEALGSVRAVAFDKTGTLTYGRPEVTDIVRFNGYTEDEILSVAAALEQRSGHPIAGAIRRRAEGLEVPEVEQFESLTGQGVRARIGGKVYKVGKPGLFENGAQPNIGEIQRSGQTAVLVGTESELLGAVTVADTVRDNAAAAVAALREQGIEKVVMLTGDSEETAQTIARRLGVDEWRAELLPEDKVAAVEELKQQYGQIAMIGDGVNDAPALATSTVGIAMGAAGSDTALETADVALMSDDLSKLPYLFELSRASRRVIRQNVWASILLKITLAVGVFPGLVTLIVAVLVGDMGTSLGVTGNALRLARIKPRTNTPK